MAAATAILTAAGIAANLGMAAAQQQQTNKAKAAVRDANAKLQGIQETDYLAGLQVPTLGANLAMDAEARRESTMLSALQGAGAEAVIGGVPQLVQQGQEQDLNIAAGLQEAEYNRDLQVGMNKQNIESRRVGREYEQASLNLAGAQQNLAQSRQNTQDYIMGALQTGLTGGLQMAKERPLYPETPAESTVGNYTTSPEMQKTMQGINSRGLSQTQVTNPYLGTAPPQINRYSKPVNMYQLGLTPEESEAFRMQKINEAINYGG